jgi:hypothetical protein
VAVASFRAQPSRFEGVSRPGPHPPTISNSTPTLFRVACE